MQPCTKEGIQYYSFMKNIDDYFQNKNFVNYASYKIKGSIFNKDSWKKIE